MALLNFDRFRHPAFAYGALLISLFASATPSFAQGPYLDEIVFDHSGADVAELIEVWGNTTSAAFSVLVIDSTGNPGQILLSLPVGASNGSQIWSSGALAAETLPNTSTTYLLVQAFSGTVGFDLDTDNDGLFDSTPWTITRDDIAFSDGSGGDVFYSPVVLGPSFDGISAAPGGASRLPSGVDTNALADWVRNDFEGAGLTNPSGATLEAGEAWNTPAFVNRRREEDYWNGVTMTNSAQLRTDIHQRIDDHQRHNYSSSLTDTWDILEAADEDPQNPSNIVALYLNESYAKFGGGTGPYNREHTWPQSMGFPDEGITNSPRTDCHHLFLDDVDTNADRGSRPFGTCASGCTEMPTVATNGHGGQGGGYPGDSNWYGGTDGATGTMEVWLHRRGDVARAQLYMDVRYEGGNHGATTFAEPDLVLTDSTSLIASTQTGNNESLAYMGRLTTLLAWHNQDPVDDDERRRNDVVWKYQGNRNPFVDHPEWVACVWGGSCTVGPVDPPFFADGFETGNTSAWSAVSP